MKRSIIATAVFSGIFISTGAFSATEYDSGVLQINGKVVGTTCQFIGVNTAEITLNEIGEDKLSTLNAGEVYDSVMNSTQVPLKIQCAKGKEPRISFSDTQFDSNNITYNNGTAKGVGFAVYYGDDNKKVDPQEKMTISGNAATGEYEIKFSARYARLADGADVAAGDVKSTLTLTVVTD